MQDIRAMLSVYKSSGTQRLPSLGQWLLTFSKAGARSFINRLNSRGARMQPCLTPLLVVIFWDKVPDWGHRTLQDVLVYRDLIRSKSLLSIPSKVSLFQSNPLSIESNAPFKSIKATYSLALDALIVNKMRENQAVVNGRFTLPETCLLRSENAVGANPGPELII